MEPQPITFSSTISFWTHYRATRAIVNRLLSTYIAWGFFVGVPLLLVIVMLCLGQDIFAPGAYGLPTWAIPVGGLLFMLVFKPLIQCLNISSMRRRNPSISGVQTYTITSAGYTIKGSLFDTTLKWDAFHKAIETKEFILLYVSTRWAHFIPKAATTASDLQAIRTIIREKLGSKAKLQVA
ncbi:MAG: YcxB family protein [Prosthecobacter sp.]|uniref:YcxB family protein n=1 Tax=Prosthecobacter sp. TaxID=1965333 RepID=UPI0025CBFABF|nr:YcxB family protein [Prosthecobacter sp.]MCF7786191.1 YcxB family protein [Prosthecobacter sp.]